MKSKFLAFIALVAATLSLSSCLNSDETVVEYTNDTAITSFSWESSVDTRRLLQARIL